MSPWQYFKYKIFKDEGGWIPRKIRRISLQAIRNLRSIYEHSNSAISYRDWETDRKSTRLNSSHSAKSRMPSSA